MHGPGDDRLLHLAGTLHGDAGTEGLADGVGEEVEEGDAAGGGGARGCGGGGGEVREQVPLPEDRAPSGVRYG